MCQVPWRPGRGNDWVGSVEKVSDSPQKTTEVGGRLGMYREETGSTWEGATVCRIDWEMSVEKKAEARK